MKLYEVLAPGYQSPLTKTQIAELFQAGRLGRDHRCKQLAQKEWRTIDELFPLLKYQSVAFAYHDPPEPDGGSIRPWHLIVALLIAMFALATLWFNFRNHPTPTAPVLAQVTEIRWPRSDATPSSSNAVPPSPAQPQPEEPAREARIAPASHPEKRNHIATLDPHRAEPQRRPAAEQQRQQAEQTRLQEERARREEKARGQDTIIPLDQACHVNVGGATVTVKIHDNDVTSFDVWINGLRRREVPKLKGITQSGTDETPIYDNGRARLYYVWEISGKVNHCRLRVREN